MKVLIVYDTVSPLKVTANVAETIGGVLKEKGIEVTPSLSMMLTGQPSRTSIV